MLHIDKPLTLDQYRYIKSVRDGSPFTAKMNIHTYIDGVKFRLAQWYGIEKETITDQDVYNYLKKVQKTFQK